MKLKPPKPKRINFELIPANDNGHEPEPYKLLREIRDKFHDDIREANIALAWRKSLKRDRDGHLMLGKCVKAGDLQKEFAVYDFIILLNREVWLSDEFTPDKKRALIDHELCHATFAPDKDGFKKRDERERYVWRTRKHDIEEFTEIVARHGLYKRDLVQFAEALLKKKDTPPLVAMMEPASDVPVEASQEEKSRTRKQKSHVTVRVKMRGQDAILPDPRKPPADGANA